MRESSSRVCRLSMPSFLKKSSLGESEPGASLKCCSARVRTSWVVFSRVGIILNNLAFPGLKREQTDLTKRYMELDSWSKRDFFRAYLNALTGSIEFHLNHGPSCLRFA